MAKKSTNVWTARLAKAEKFMQTAHEHGRKVYARYKDEREEATQLNAKRANLFYSNVQTIRESLFNSMPQVDVSRRHKGDFEDDVSRVAAIILQRGLTYEVQCLPGFDEILKSAILDRLVPGIGVAWLSFEMEAEEITHDDQDAVTEGAEHEAAESVVTYETVAGTEKVCVDYVYWEDFLYDPQRIWSQVRWVARRLLLTKAEIVDRWGEESFAQVESAKNLGTLTPKEVENDKYAVYEIWDKSKKQVIFTTKGAEAPFEVKDDPYQLRGFFPCPRPLIASPTTTAFLPVTDYHIAQDQYNQLDTLYARIALIVDAVKVAGAYDAAQTSLGQMLNGAENKLVPVDNWAMYAESGGAKGMIDWYPVEQVVTVLQQLQMQFEATKSVLYEVTGMSDIIRGASNQYETAKAQQIKAQFASVRLNGYQRDVAEFVTGIFEILGEMVTQLYGDEKLQAIVGPLHPQDAQYAPQAVMMLRNDFLAHARVSVKADSMVQADWALEKGQRMELMGFLSQFIQSMQPMLQQAPDMGNMMLSLLKWTITGYRGSQEVEGIIDQHLDALEQKSREPQPPPPPSPEQVKAQAELQKMQMEAQQDQQKAQMDLKLAQQKAALEAESAARAAQLEQQKLQNELMFEQQRNQMELQRQQSELMFERMMGQMKLEMEELKISLAERKAESALEFSEEQHMLNLEAKKADQAIRQRGKRPPKNT